jgi:uncharacterized protein (TIGR00251 family)
VSGLRASERDGALTVDVLVQPRAARPGVGPVVGDRLRVAVSAPPVDGKANEAVVAVLAEALGVPRGAVEIVRGESGRRKTVRIRGATLAALSRFSGNER